MYTYLFSCIFIYLYLYLSEQNTYMFNTSTPPDASHQFNDFIEFDDSSGATIQSKGPHRYDSLHCVGAVY